MQSVIIRSVMVTTRGPVNSGQKNRMTDTINGNKLSPKECLGSALQSEHASLLCWWTESCGRPFQPLSMIFMLYFSSLMFIS